MPVNLETCFICNNNIDKSNTIYRAFDCSICSNECLKIRYNLIEQRDPYFKNPSLWDSVSDEEIQERHQTLLELNLIEFNLHNKFLPILQPRTMTSNPSLTRYLDSVDLTRMCKSAPTILLNYSQDYYNTFSTIVNSGYIATKNLSMQFIDSYININIHI